MVVPGREVVASFHFEVEGMVVRSKPLALSVTNEKRVFSCQVSKT